MKFEYFFWGGGYHVPMRPQAIIEAALALGYPAALLAEQSGSGHGFGIRRLPFHDTTSEAGVLCIGGGEVDKMAALPRDRPLVLDYSDCWMTRDATLVKALEGLKEDVVCAWSITEATTRELRLLGFAEEKIRQVPNAFHPRLLSIPEAALFAPRQKHVAIIGTLGDWTEPAVIASLARRMPDYWFFVFSNFDPPGVLCSVPNIHVYQQTHPFAFISLLAGSVCSLAPFAPTDFALGCDPIKYYEAVALNTPVLATNIVSLEGRVGAQVFYSRDTNETVNWFEAQIRACGGHVFDDPASLAAWRRENHWQARFAPALKEVKERWMN